MKQLLLATHNAHKLDELRRILARVSAELPDVEVVGLDDIGPFDAPKETGATFIDNAVLKAREAANQCDLITIADDSGITIDALNGMPGVLSARWAGKHGDDKANLELVLAQVADVPDDRLGAAFVCAAALVVPGTNRGKVAEERMLGHLVREPRGDNGFGYDPIFVALGETLTNGELAPERKDEISHRGKALRALVPYIITAMNDPELNARSIRPDAPASPSPTSLPTSAEPTGAEPAGPTDSAPVDDSADEPATGPLPHVPAAAEPPVEPPAPPGSPAAVPPAVPPVPAAAATAPPVAPVAPADPAASYRESAAQPNSPS